MQTENSNRNLCQKYIALCKLKTVTETCLKINCIMQTENSNRNQICIVLQTENSNRNLCQKLIVLCKLKTVTETCLKHI